MHAFDGKENERFVLWPFKNHLIIIIQNTIGYLGKKGNTTQDSSLLFRYKHVGAFSFVSLACFLILANTNYKDLLVLD